MYKGNGYGSRTSLCLTLLFVGSFVAFLFFFNVLSLSTSTTIYKLASTEDYSYEFGRDSLIFASIEDAVPSLYILDGSLKIVDNVSLTNSNCLDNLTS